MISVVRGYVEVREAMFWYSMLRVGAMSDFSEPVRNSVGVRTSIRRDVGGDIVFDCGCGGMGEVCVVCNGGDVVGWLNSEG